MRIESEVKYGKLKHYRPPGLLGSQKKNFMLNLQDSKFGSKDAEQNTREKNSNFFVKQQRKYFFLTTH